MGRRQICQKTTPILAHNRPVGRHHNATLFPESLDVAAESAERMSQAAANVKPSTRESGLTTNDGGWLRRLVRPLVEI
jgi:hypothetical protein